MFIVLRVVSSAWLEFRFVEPKVTGSNPVQPVFFLLYKSPLRLVWFRTLYFRYKNTGSNPVEGIPYKVSGICLYKQMLVVCEVNVVYLKIYKNSIRVIFRLLWV